MVIVWYGPPYTTYRLDTASR